MSTDRMVRVNELLKRELGSIFTFLVTPHSSSLVTVTGVKTSPDLRNATVFVSVYGSESQVREVMSLLHSKRGELQSQLAGKVVLKYTPRLHFRLDRTAAEADRVLSILESLDIPDDDNPDSSLPDKQEP